MRSTSFALLALFLLSSLGLAAPQPLTGPTMTIQVNDKATGDPIPQANVTAGNERTTTDDYGQCSLVVQERGRYFDITVRKNGYVSMGARWQNIHPDQKLPEQLTFNMEPGTSIGGTVVDETGKPVSGATVHLLSFDQDARQEGKITSSMRADPVTDAKGIWSTNTAPAELKNVDYLVEASGYFNSNMYQNTPPVAQLRDRTAVMTVQHAASIVGKIFDPTGKPLANVDVMAGEEGWGGVRHRAHTNDAGEFTLSNLRPGSVNFAVMADDYAPQLVSAMVPSTQPAEVHLSAGTPMKFHVVDVAGKPLVGVVISVDQWRDARYVDHTLRTNADGNATWAGAPADEVEMSFTKRRYGTISGRPITATTQPINITLGPITHIKGTVVDAITGQPIKDFKIIPGVVWRNAEDLFWQDTPDNSEYFGLADGHDGQFDFTPRPAYPEYAIRIEAPGYLPTDSRRFDDAQGNLSLEFKMAKGTSITGTVYDADHKPVAGTNVYLCNVPQNGLDIQNGGVVQASEEGTFSVQTDAQGHFDFLPQADAFVIVCATDQGYARLDVPGLHPAPPRPGFAPLAKLSTTRPASYDLAIQPWCTVQGTLMVGSKAGVHVELGLQSINRDWDGRRPEVYLNYSAATDSEGKFKFGHVPPVELRLAKIIRITNFSNYSAGAVVNLQPGQLVNLHLGGIGRPVNGKFALPSNWHPNQWVAWNTRMHPHVDLPKLPTTPLAIRLGSEEAQRKWLEEWTKSPEGKVYEAAIKKMNAEGPEKTFTFAIQPDGSFHIDDVPAGNYDLIAQFYPDAVMRTGGWNHPMGTAEKQIVIPKMPGGQSDEPLDVGTIPVTPPPTMQ